MPGFDSSGPADFRAAVQDVHASVFRPELVVHELTAPTGLAPFAFALAADVRPAQHGIDSVLGTGRFVLLYDADQPDAWGGAFRVVCFAQAPLEPEIGSDPFLAGVAWSWLMDSLSARGASAAAASGTATTQLSTGYGELSGQGDGALIELRASWSPTNGGFTAHAEAWGDLLALLAGLPPASDVVGLLPQFRAARD